MSVHFAGFNFFLKKIIFGAPFQCCRLRCAQSTTSPCPCRYLSQSAEIPKTFYNLKTKISFVTFFNLLVERLFQFLNRIRRQLAGALHLWSGFNFNPPSLVSFTSQTSPDCLSYLPMAGEFPCQPRLFCVISLSFPSHRCFPAKGNQTPCSLGL
jgi:hypothetical protein